MNKSLYLVVVITAIIIALFTTACGSEKTDNNKNSEQENENENESVNKSNDTSVTDLQNGNAGSDGINEILAEQDEASDSKEAAVYLDTIRKYFPATQSEIIYNGITEYGHIIKYSGEKTAGNSVVITYSGTMSDGFGEDERGSRTFIVEYQILNNSVIEAITNKDYTDPEKTDRLNSVIPFFTALHGEITEGGSWKQKFNFKNKEYVATTTIKDVTDNSFQTETIVRNIEGFTDNTYVENRFYEAGSGLVSFSNNLYAMQDSPDFIFSYSISEIK